MRREPIPQLIIGLIYLLILTRFIWPIDLPLWAKIAMAALALVALQYHRWSKLSSGSVFSPEFPRPVVALFNWAMGAIVLLALLQLALDAGLLLAIPFKGGVVSAPDKVRYGLAALAAVAAAIGVQQAMRIPPLKDVEIGIRGLPSQFDGYTILQLTDLHISRLFPASWARNVVERSNKLGVDLIAITGDLIDGTIEARRTDIKPLQADIASLKDQVSKLQTDVSAAKASADAASRSASAAQSSASQAAQAASGAQSTANQALSAAQAAQSSVDATNEKIDRMFKKSVSK